MTQTHLLIATALFARKGTRRRNTAIIAGALIPDAAIFILFIYAVITGIPQDTLWSETYWSEPWQTWVTLGNSAFLYIGLLAASLILISPQDGRARWQALPALLALAALTHLAGDFPVHNSDAHMHFQPLSDWRFRSPISYWEAAHHGRAFFTAEIILGFALIAVLIRRWRRPSRPEVMAER